MFRKIRVYYLALKYWIEGDSWADAVEFAKWIVGDGWENYGGY